jgi:hypothetical protein
VPWPVMGCRRDLGWVRGSELGSVETRVQAGGFCWGPAFLPLPQVAHSEGLTTAGRSRPAEDEQAFCQQHQTILVAWVGEAFSGH